MTNAVVQQLTEGKLPALIGATKWMNSPPLTAADLDGKVVLVNFWTYTCINWLRTLPYVRAWAEKYREKGLVVLGIHTPEFEFEHDIQNVRLALESMGIMYPVVVDNDYALWEAFDNRCWPALYFIDAQGRIRHHQFGEGEYELSEQVIQQLLAENGAAGVHGEPVSVQPRGPEVPADWKSLSSPETYLGYNRTSDFASPGGIQQGKNGIYEDPYTLSLNQWSLAGDWTIGAEAITSNFEKDRITYHFRARDLNLVMGPNKAGLAIPFRVHVDNQPPGKAHGSDTDEQGRGIASDQRLYQLIRHRNQVKDHQFDIEFENPGIEALAFTFG
jgi:thiol-disulfide isomerase/thioredoxin